MYTYLSVDIHDDCAECNDRRTLIQPSHANCVGGRHIGSHPSPGRYLDDPSHHLRPYPERAILPSPTQETPYKEPLVLSR